MLQLSLSRGDGDFAKQIQNVPFRLTLLYSGKSW